MYFIRTYIVQIVSIIQSDYEIYANYLNFQYVDSSLFLKNNNFQLFFT